MSAHGIHGRPPLRAGRGSFMHGTNGRVTSRGLGPARGQQTDPLRNAAPASEKCLPTVLSDHDTPR